eukprot:365800-Chlamydomonas_euryale.AAC.12
MAVALFSLAVRSAAVAACARPKPSQEASADLVPLGSHPHAAHHVYVAVDLQCTGANASVPQTAAYGRPTACQSVEMGVAMSFSGCPNPSHSSSASRPRLDRLEPLTRHGARRQEERRVFLHRVEPVQSSQQPQRAAQPHLLTVGKRSKRVERVALHICPPERHDQVQARLKRRCSRVCRRRLAAHRSGCARCRRHCAGDARHERTLAECQQRAQARQARAAGRHVEPGRQGRRRGGGRLVVQQSPRNLLHHDGVVALERRVYVGVGRIHADFVGAREAKAAAALAAVLQRLDLAPRGSRLEAARHDVDGFGVGRVAPVDHVLESAHRDVQRVCCCEDREEARLVREVVHDDLVAKLRALAAVAHRRRHADLHAVNAALADEQPAGCQARHHGAKALADGANGAVIYAGVVDARKHVKHRLARHAHVVEPHLRHAAMHSAG